MDITEIGSVIIGMMVLGYIIACMAPTHWQTLTGYLIITFIGLPACALLLAGLSRPAFLIPVAIILAVLAAARRRA